MEAFKLAFETVLVGALALPWLALMMVLVNPKISRTIGHLTKLVPKECMPALAGVVAFSLAYLLGSAISPVAREFLNDIDAIGFPTEDKIQTLIMERPEGGQVLSSAVPKRGNLAVLRDTLEQKRSILGTNATFRQQETTVLLHGAEASERINRLHERLTVLTGATFSGFVLVLLCVFAWCGSYRGQGEAARLHSSLRLRAVQWATYLPCLATMLWGVVALLRDWNKHDIDDPPIMELVLLILGFFGLCITASKTVVLPALRSGMLFASFLTILSCGGYLSTEPSYVHEVLDSYAVITSPQPIGSYSAAQAPLRTGTLDQIPAVLR
jgi:hypothetical protein